MQGQVALVTGGGRGFGSEMARLLALKGVHVAIASRTASELASTASRIRCPNATVLPLELDVTDAAAVSQAVEEIESALGPIQILINNAGQLKSIGPAWNAKVDEWWSDVTVNLLGTFLCTRFVLERMVKRAEGRIINFASGATPFLSAYDCSKFAIARFTYTVAMEARPHGVSIFSMFAGPAHTRMTENLMASREAQYFIPQLLAQLKERSVPLTSVQDVLFFLLSGKADGLTGRYFDFRENLDLMLSASARIEQENLYAPDIRTLTRQ